MVEQAQPGTTPGGPQPVDWGGDIAGGTPSWRPPPEPEARPAEGAAPSPPDQPQSYTRQVPPPEPPPPPQGPSYWQHGDPLPWAGSPDAPAMPPPQSGPQIDLNQLNPAVIAANEQ